MPASPLLINIAHSPATSVWSGLASTSVTFRNLDSVNTVYLGTVTTIAVGGGNTIPLNPGDSITVDGSVNWFAIASAGTSPLNVVPGSVTFSPGTIDISGTPTINVSGNVNVVGVGGTFPPGNLAQIISAVNQSINPNFTSSIIDVSSYYSYNLTMTAFNSAQGNGGAPLTSEILITWFADLAATTPIYTERYEAWLGNSLANATAVKGAGPVHGPFCQVQVFGGPSCTMSQLVVYGTPRTLPKPFWEQTVPGGMNSGLSTIAPLPGLPGDNNILIDFDGLVVAANQIVWMPLPLRPGPVYARFQTSQALSHNFIVYQGSGLLNGQLQAGGNGPGVLWNPGNTAGGEFEFNFLAPHAPLYCIVATTATPATIGFSVIGSD